MSTHDNTTSPLRLPPAVTPLDVKWTSRLIKRDVEKMCKAAKKGLSKKAKKIAEAFVHSKSNIDKHTHRAAPSKTPAPTKKKPQHLQKLSVSTTVETPKPPVFSTRPNTGATTNTEVTKDSTIPLLKRDRLYDLMLEKVDSWYKSRPGDLSAKDRWKVRGTALLLYMVVEICASNPCYDEFRNGRPDPAQEASIRGILQRAASKGGEPILSALGVNPTRRVSDLPVAVYSKVVNTNAVRVDSAHSTPPSALWEALRIQDGAQENAPPAAESIWAAILVALSDRSATGGIVEALLHEILPELDVEEFLVRIGDPAQRLREGEDDMLREKLRPLLFPEYEQLF